jgi:peptidoglycan/xylan/chitin deacetylase (PgdA/CDA1 family)
MRVVSLLFHDVFVASPRESGFQSAAAARYKLSVDQFEAQLRGMARVRRDAPMLIRGSGIGDRGSGCRDPRLGDAPAPFLLTVDDGGVSAGTLVADRLEALGWRAHCFVPTDAIGRRGFLAPAQIRDLHARGHVIGSHSASHPTRFNAWAVGAMRAEWSRSRQVLEDLLGHAVIAASVPGGYYSRGVARAARDAGLQVLFTSEPTTTPREEDGVVVLGRFTIRHGHPPDMAGRLLLPAPWTRLGAWAMWNAKGLVKPLLGSSYMRVADWIHAGSEPPGRVTEEERA